MESCFTGMKKMDKYKHTILYVQCYTIYTKIVTPQSGKHQCEVILMTCIQDMLNPAYKEHPRFDFGDEKEAKEAGAYFETVPAYKSHFKISVYFWA